MITLNTLPQQPLHDHWTTLNGKRIFARAASHPGQGQHPPIVLVHAIGTSSRYMEPTATRLAPYGPVYVPDQPGFGQSEPAATILTVPQLADFFAAWMEANDIPPAVLIGNSTGCSTIVDFAVRYPDKVLGVVLIGPAIDPHGRTWPQEAWRYLLTGFHEAPALFIQLTRDYLAAGLRRIIQSEQYAFDYHIEAHLPALQMPVLIVRGEEDAFAPQAWVEEAVHLVPQGELRIIPGAGHVLNYSEPDAFTNTVLRWLYTYQLTSAAAARDPSAAPTKDGSESMRVSAPRSSML